MAFDEKEFVAEVNTAIDDMEEDAAHSDADENSEGSEENNEGESNDSLASNEAVVDNEAGAGEGSAVNEGDAAADDGPAEDEGDQEGDRSSGEESEGEEVTPPTVSDYVIEEAIRAGIPPNEVRKYSSEENLLRLIEYKRRADRLAPEHDSDDSEKQTTTEDLLAKIPELDSEKFEPETVAMFDALKGIIREQQNSINSIHEGQAAAEAAQLENSTREVTGWFDREVSDLGEDFVEALGEGGFNDLPEGSPQLVKRNEIALHVEMLFAGYQASGIKVPPRGDVFKSAARSVLHDEFRQVGEKKTAGKLAKRSSQHTQRASGKKANSNLSPDEEAANALDRAYPKLSE